MGLWHPEDFRADETTRCDAAHRDRELLSSSEMQEVTHRCHQTFFVFS